MEEAAAAGGTAAGAAQSRGGGTAAGGPAAGRLAAGGWGTEVGRRAAGCRRRPRAPVSAARVCVCGACVCCVRRRACVCCVRRVYVCVRLACVWVCGVGRQPIRVLGGVCLPRVSNTDARGRNFFYFIFLLKIKFKCCF